jgi:hypothetical protein
MADEQKAKSGEPEKKREILELNKETVQDLAEGEAEAAQGGFLAVANPTQGSVGCCPTTHPDLH